MQKIWHRCKLCHCALLVVGSVASEGRAGVIVGSGGLEGLGTFTANVSYMAIDAAHATLTVELWNTSSAANGGYLTAFAFNNPFDSITSAALVSTNSNFELLGSPDFNGGIPAPPFGSFDLGASSSGDFLGGGSPVGGIAVGGFSNFTFALTGAGLDLLTLESFFGGASAPDQGQQDSVAFLARFRGFENGGSDKVPGVLEGGSPTGELPNTPEPATLVLGAIAGVFGLTRRCRSRSS